MGRGFRELDQAPTGTIFVKQWGEYGTYQSVDQLEQRIIMNEGTLKAHNIFRAWVQALVHDVSVDNKTKDSELEYASDILNENG